MTAAAKPEVAVSDTADDLAADTAARVAAVLQAAIDARRVAHVAITGGGILEAVLAALTAVSLDWSRVHVWWGDERFVAADSPDRNDVPACRALFDHAPADQATLHRMPASGAEFGDDVDAAAAAYAAELTKNVPATPVPASAMPAEGGVAPSGVAMPALDLALLGIGPDGHCCSLFPEHPGLQVLDRAVTAVRNSPKPPPTRLSLTFPALDAVDEVWFVASGDGKADAVARALGGADREQVPSAGPRGRSHTRWLLDRAAAAHLPPDLA